MLFGILMLYGIIQGSVACWSTTDCPVTVSDCPPVYECPVSDCPFSTCPVSDCAVSESTSVSDSPVVPHSPTVSDAPESDYQSTVTNSPGPDSPTVSTSPTVTVSARSVCTCPNNTVNATAVPPPLLTTEQADTLFMLSQSLDLLSCEELKKKIYNTTEPPIQLSDDQMTALRNYYPEHFRDTNPSVSEEPLASEVQCNSTGNNRRKRSPVTSVCSTKIDYITFNLALDKRGEVVYVPQLTRYDLYQEFQESLCTQTACFPSLNCQCDHNVSPYTVTAVVSYIRRNNNNNNNYYLKFYVSEIQLRSCSAYL